MAKKMNHKVIVVLGLSSNAPAMVVVRRLRAVSSGVRAARTQFPNSPVSPDQLDADADAIEKKEAAVLTRAAGTREERDAAKETGETHLHQTADYVQLVVDNAPPEQREALVAAAAMFVKKSPSRHQPDLSVRPGKVSGEVDAVAKAAGRRAAYEWEWSSDGGKTYVRGPTTLQARVTLEGLPVGATVLVRCRYVTKDGQQDWLDPVSIVVK